MSDSSGSTLQLPPKVKLRSNVNLLIATNSTAEFEKIVEPLQKAQITFTGDRLPLDQLLNNLPRKQYSAILIESFEIGEQNSANLLDLLKDQLQTLRCTYPQVPLILITDLGESAIKLIQSSVDAYILKQNLHQLPQVLKQTLHDTGDRKLLINQQQKLIEQQQAIINQLKAEKQSWLEQEKLRQEHIAHLNHELRSPVSSMLGFAGMLKGEYYGTLNDKQMQYVTALVSVGERMLKMVGTYLDMVKIDANKHTLDLEKLVVEEICQASLHEVAPKAKQKKLELIFTIEEEIDYCTVDSMDLIQILVNLLTNAIKFTDRGSITLDVKLRDGRLYFAVLDTGTGIAPKNIGKLFKPYPGISNHQESTGLGLTLSQKIARNLGGKIEVTSELGVGSCFVLNIPQHQ